MGPDVHARALTPATSPDRAAPGRSPRSILREILEAVPIAVVFALFVRTFLLQAYVVPTASMEDNILVGDHLIVNKFVFAPRAVPLFEPFLPQRAVSRGDVFVFKFPNDPARDFVKRAVAVGDDVVEIRDKVVFVNGTALAEPEVTHSDRRIDAAGRRDQFGPARVSRGQIFALGDNRDSSNDSRFWGTVPAANVKGRALLVYWSVAPGRGGGVLRRTADFFARTRWNRTFLPVR